MKISELQDGYKGKIKVLLINVGRGVTNKGAPYLSFTMQDNTGSLDAKFWNVNEEILHHYKPGLIVEIEGDVISHQKQLQFRVQKANVLDQENQDVNEFAQEGPVPKEELIQRVNAHLDAIQNDKIKVLVKETMKKYEKDFYEYPAATKNHHDFVGGLATHVLGMLDLANYVGKQYPLLNQDLLIGGVFLHDIGKLHELSGAIITEYTTEGKMLGHISMMQAELECLAKTLKIDGEEVMLLKHMILSHHGVREYGSPVLPMIPEAEILHLLDNIDARMNTMEKALKMVEPGEFTQRVFALENRNFYKSKM